MHRHPLLLGALFMARITRLSNLGSRLRHGCLTPSPRCICTPSVPKITAIDSHLFDPWLRGAAEGKSVSLRLAWKKGEDVG